MQCHPVRSADIAVWIPYYIYLETEWGLQNMLIFDNVDVKQYLYLRIPSTTYSKSSHSPGHGIDTDGCPIHRTPDSVLESGAQDKKRMYTNKQ